MVERQRQANPIQTLQAGIAAWLLPGAGHWLLGQRRLACVFFAAITFPYLAGVVLGGVKYTVNPVENRWLFLAESGVGSYTIAFTLISGAIDIPPENQAAYLPLYPIVDIAQIYLAVAGLLNVLAVLDVLARAQTGGQPVFYYEMQQRHLREEAAAEFLAAEGGGATDPASSVPQGADATRAAREGSNRS